MYACIIRGAERQDNTRRDMDESAGADIAGLKITNDSARVDNAELDIDGPCKLILACPFQFYEDIKEEYQHCSSYQK